MRDYSNYPNGLPTTWYQIWNYTFSRSNGKLLRMVIQQALEENVLQQFNMMSVLNSDIITDFINYQINKRRNGGVINEPFYSYMLSHNYI